jgi:hypothetical protein
LICDRRTDDFLVVDRLDGTSYPVAMCAACVEETALTDQPFLLAHDLIDARNAYRTRRTAA